MFCSKCGQQLVGNSPQFCAACGSATSSSSSVPVVPHPLVDLEPDGTRLNPVADEADSAPAAPGTYQDDPFHPWFAKSGSRGRAGLSPVADEADSAQAAPGITQHHLSADAKNRQWAIAAAVAAGLVLLVIVGMSASNGRQPVAPRKVDPESGRLSEMQSRWDALEPWQRQGACLEWRSNGPAGYFSLNGIPPDQRPLLTTLLDRNC